MCVVWMSKIAAAASDGCTCNTYTHRPHPVATQTDKGATSGCFKGGSRGGSGGSDAFLGLEDAISRRLAAAGGGDGGRGGNGGRWVAYCYVCMCGRGGDESAECLIHAIRISHIYTHHYTNEQQRRARGGQRDAWAALGHASARCVYVQCIVGCLGRMWASH